MGILDGHETPYEALKTPQQVVRLGRGRKAPHQGPDSALAPKGPLLRGHTDPAGDGRVVCRRLRRNHRRASEAYPLPFGGPGDVGRAEGVLYENNKNS
jgi:hypothetical protein